MGLVLAGFDLLPPIIYFEMANDARRRGFMSIREEDS